jgi:hypothetical protein
MFSGNDIAQALAPRIFLAAALLFGGGFITGWYTAHYECAGCKCNGCCCGDKCEDSKKPTTKKVSRLDCLCPFGAECRCLEECDCPEALLARADGCKCKILPACQCNKGADCDCVELGK